MEDEPAAGTPVPTQPVNGRGPELATPCLPGGVTDEDRARFGVLLDKAAERGLLDPYDYEIRLRDLAAATSVDQMRRIVSSLPAFVAPTAVAASGRSVRPGTAAAPGLTSPRAAGRRRTSPWAMLAVLVVVVVVSLVVLSLYAGHVVRSHPSGLPAATVAARPLSAPLP